MSIRAESARSGAWWKKRSFAFVAAKQFAGSTDEAAPAPPTPQDDTDATEVLLLSAVHGEPIDPDVIAEAHGVSRLDALAQLSSHAGPGGPLRSDGDTFRFSDPERPAALLSGVSEEKRAELAAAVAAARRTPRG